MGRRDLLKKLSAGVATMDLWGNLNRRIKDDEMVPIIGNTVTNSRIFEINKDGHLGIARHLDEGIEQHHLQIDEQLRENLLQWVHKTNEELKK